MTVDIKKLKTTVIKNDKWLMNRQKKHIRMVEKSVIKLQNSILNSIQRLATNKNGRVEGVKVNLKQAQKIHKDIENIFEEQWSRKTKLIINDFKNVSEIIEDGYSYLEESVKFTGIDTTTMDVLRDGYYQSYLDIGGVHKNKVIQAMYDTVISGGEFSSLVYSIESALIGTNAVGVTGRPLVQYARLYARDMIMNFHQEVNSKMAEEAGIKHFLYIGDIIATTRPFCKRRVGKYYTREQIDSWTYRWAGKSGPAFIHRGGYNCRHHWQPIRPEWMEGKKKIDVADWNLEQRQKG